MMDEAVEETDMAVEAMDSTAVENATAVEDGVITLVIAGHQGEVHVYTKRRTRVQPIPTTYFLGLMIKLCVDPSKQ